MDRALRDRYRYRLPYPIAISYKRIGACSDVEKRLRHVLATAEMVARFLGIVALADWRRVSPPGPTGGAVHRDLAAPAFGTWLFFLERCAGLLRQAGPPPFLPELVDFVLGPDGKPTDRARRLDDLRALRNRLVHERLDARQIPAECERALAALEQVLADILFLEDYPLVVVSPVIVEKKLGAQPRFVRHKKMLAGCATTFDAETDTVEAACETAELLLLGRDGKTYLNLYPLLLYSNEGVLRRDLDGERTETRTEIDDVFFFNGGDRRGWRYSACNMGGELVSRDCSEAEPIDRALDVLVGLRASLEAA